MTMDNDTRGWIMAVISGIACVMGSSLICVDLLVRQVPSMKNFRIQDSNSFLSGALSLSFGVMLFSSLFNMLPSSRAYLIRGGYTASEAGYILMGCFLGGVIGIQIVSRVLHHFIPSHVVDCDHSHQNEDVSGDDSDPKDPHNVNADEYTRLLSRGNGNDTGKKRPQSPVIATDLQIPGTAPMETNNTQRPSLQARVTSRVATFMSGSKSSCDETGPCYGFGDPCGQECFKALARSPSKAARFSVGGSTRPQHRRASVHPSIYGPSKSVDEENQFSPTATANLRQPGNDSAKHDESHQRPPSSNSSSSDETMNGGPKHGTPSTSILPSESLRAHHHHVPANAFLSIGLQTSIAIALHKLPEGFITYATNHANPKLGVTVFLALFIHNITEGFAMALPLYLALNSRVKAMLWSSALGGISQPLGAGVAALWFRLAQHGEIGSAETAYGAMFAVTAGIMSSVALQLFSESLGLTHNRSLCTFFAFVGMALLGFSSALTAD